MPSTLKITYVFFALGSAQASEQQMRLRSLSTNEQDMVPDICMKEMVKTKGSMCTLDVVSIIHANELKVSGHSSVNTLSASDSIEAGGKITSKELAVSDYAWVGTLGATNVEAEELKVTRHAWIEGDLTVKGDIVNYKFTSLQNQVAALEEQLKNLVVKFEKLASNA